MSRASLLIITSESITTYAGDALSAFTFAKAMQNYLPVTFCSYSVTGCENGYYEQDGVSFFTIYYKGTRLSSKLISRLRLLWRLFLIGRNHEIWLIYGLLPGALLVLILGRLTGRKVIFRPTLFGFDDLSRRSLRNEIITYLSSGFYIRNRSLASRDLKRRKASLTFFSSQGVDTTRFYPFKDDAWRDYFYKEHGLLLDQPIILMVGHLSKRKGFSEIASWINALPYNPILLHVGMNKENPCEQALLREVGKILGNRFIGIEPTQDIEKYYQLSTLFLMASYAEGFPSNAILEAMACGLPVLCRRIEGVDDYLYNNFNAVLYSNFEEFEQGYRKLISKGSFAQDISKNALLSISEKHDVRMIAKDFVAFLKSLNVKV